DQSQPQRGDRSVWRSSPQAGDLGQLQRWLHRTLVQQSRAERRLLPGLDQGPRRPHRAVRYRGRVLGDAISAIVTPFPGVAATQFFVNSVNTTTNGLD